MKKILCFFLVFVAVLLTVCAAKANVCLLSGEGGASNNCDSGTSQAGLPVHSTQTISKKGTQGLCNNVNAFADSDQALNYAKSHEYDDVYVEQGCYKPKCKYNKDKEAACKSAEGADCCKSILNGECWHKCNICRFNMIGDSYYPYADDNIKGCSLIDKANIISRNAVYSSGKNYRITKLNNFENSWDNNVWMCDNEEKTTILNGCLSAARSAKMVKGSEGALINNIDYLCIEGAKKKLNNDLFTEYGCPYEALKCNNNIDASKYFSTAKECEIRAAHNVCRVTRTPKAYAEPECWKAVETCPDLAHDDYKIGVHRSMGSICSESDNTQLRYYCHNADEHTYFACLLGSTNIVELENEACGICDCVSGTLRVSECNDTIYNIIGGYYAARSACPREGYTTYATSVGENQNCEACPYNAMYWRCDK